MVFDINYLFSLLTGILSMTHIAWATVFLLGRLAIQKKEYEISTATPLRWWTGILAVALSLEFLFAYIVRFFFPDGLKFYFIYFDMLAIPIGAIVMVILVNPQPISLKRTLFNIVPYIVCCTTGMIIQQTWYFHMIIALIACYVIAMIIYVFVHGLHHEEELKNTYSSLVGRSIRWMAVVPILLVVMIINYSIYIFSKNPNAPIVYYILAFFIWNYVYINLYQMVVVQESTLVTQDDENEGLISKEETNALQSDNKDVLGDDATFLEQLRQVCEVPELFTNSDLTRDELARIMQMGHTQFTARLKSSTGMTFYDYINRLRIQKAVVLIEEGKMDMWSVGQSVGYSYRSTFYRAFSAIQGCTPVEYQNQIQNTSNESAK